MPEIINWQKSSFSGGADGNHCIEVCSAGHTVAIRESDAPAVTVATTPSSLKALIRGVKKGELCPLGKASRAVHLPEPRRVAPTPTVTVGP
ncbi:DUF397 domain-containing protein [Streptomyces lycii]|uniref:DUF397 domain-containing protein n=1 Tax=Streptomyces lycii TaxID=2654337 RepID=A0ABQ7FBN1_9ACTN|nr:DUF397 domain-containing protein [Streptomyces lycii]KAF4405388.1 DUF397 domain-containing protein [Streptomyces lycii]